MLPRSTTIGLWFLLGSVVAQTSFNLTTVNPIDSNICVAPADYTACLDLAVTAEQQCMNEAPNDAARNGCGCGGYIEQMNCFAGSCWNRVCYIRYP